MPMFKVRNTALEKISRYFRFIVPDFEAQGMIGINVGSGARWPKKMLTTEGILQLIELLTNRFPEKLICILGGDNEKEKIDRISSQVSSRIIVPDTRESLHLLAAVISMLDILITGDTLSLHLATALNVPSVALFGPTSIHEIHDNGGLIKKIAPTNLDAWDVTAIAIFPIIA